MKLGPTGGWEAAAPFSMAAYILRTDLRLAQIESEGLRDLAVLREELNLAQGKGTLARLDVGG
jgi:hypothetical protein